MNQALTDPNFFIKSENWQRWKDSHGQEDIIIENVEFRDFDFCNIDFSRVRFLGCYFDCCLFQNANLISTNLSHSSFHACDFDGAKMIASNLSHSEFRKCNFQQVNLLTAILNDTSIINSDLTHLDLQSFNLIGITLDLCDLRKQNLAGKNLTNASLKRVDLRGANLDKTIFNGANLAESLLTDAQIRATQFKSSNLTGIDFVGAELSRVNFEGASMRGCDFRDADLSGACLARADITNTSLFNAETIGWDIRDIRCDYAYWDRDSTVKTEYKPHEFERIYAESLIIELKYDFRLTANEIATLPILIDHLQACHWGVALRLKSVKDIAGGALVQLVVDEAGNYSLNDLEISLKEEASRIQNAQLALRADRNMQKRFKEAIAGIKDQFWPRLLELAAEHELDQVRNFCVLFIDLKGFTLWNEGVVSEKLSLFRGLLKPILERWKASYPNMEGDSLRATFRSARAAAECACMIRDVLMSADFELRIGIDLGQVSIVHNEVTDQSDLEGNAVSMAARLESMAEAGEIIVSEKVKHYAEQETGNFVFYPRKSQLTKAIGNKKAGDWVNIYHLQRKLN
ncbi:pentapeptide repeat-containing protein [Aliikangiella sp. IMCC44359]|uniref:pentapeptide repeat-containing protein n=1 Tax=Aliikangiella sp. IMCC44359 TaxID=3459125 RepID=UPI00403B35EB